MSVTEQGQKSRPHFWLNVLAGIVLVAGGVWFVAGLPWKHHDDGQRSRNHEAVQSALRHELLDAETRFRRDDRDGNGTSDFWTVDLSGLYRVTGPDGKPIALIDASFAAADASPSPEGGAARLGPPLPKAPWNASWFRMIRGQKAASAPGAGFAIAAFPAEFPMSGSFTFLMDEGGHIWSKELGAGGGDKLLEWPGATEDLTSEGWMRRP